MKQYKEDSPKNTINRIRNILYDIDLLPIESAWFHPQKELFSVRLESPTEFGQFGTNGKGRNEYYALASAYAEFIERIQNGFIVGANGLSRLFLKEIQRQVGFYYYPDECILSQEDFFHLPQSYISDVLGDSKQYSYLNAYFHRLKENGQDGVVAVPFFDVRRGETVYLPYNLTFILSGSNGMSAGNTAAESIYQALCELLERYSARTVFFDRLTPPTVPDDFISKYPKEKEIIDSIKEKGYQVIVKDFSCGISIPAIGVILLDNKYKKYRLNIGSDTSFKIALSRALTELYQGIDNDERMESLMLEIPYIEPDFFIINNANNVRRREQEIQKFIINGTGLFPSSLFQDNPSYAFNPRVFEPQESFQNDNKYIINMIQSMGFDIFIRDVSFLGFPSFYIYIPKMSVWGRKSSDDKPTLQALLREIENDKIEDIFFPSPTLLSSNYRLRRLLDLLAPSRKTLYTGVSMSKILKLEFTQNCYWSSFPVNLFISMLCFALNEYHNACIFLKEFQKESGMLNNAYYNTVYQLFEDIDNGSSLSDLKTCFPKDLIKDFSTTENIFAYIEFPTCPICDSCPLKNDCLTKANFKNYLNITKRMKVLGKDNQNTIHSFIHNNR